MNKRKKRKSNLNDSTYVFLGAPDKNNTNPTDKAWFVLFFTRDYFGIKIDR